MTLTTRTTTRKAPWAAVLTALLAIVALVFGAMALAGPANAKDDNPNKPDNPGNSQNAPGHENTPPGQNPGDTPGSSHDKMTICHYVEGKGETKAGYNIITMNEQAWAAHLAHHPGTLDVVFNGVSCPTVVEPEYCPAGSTANALLPVPAGKTVTEYCSARPPTCPDGVTPLPANGICSTTVTTTYACPDTTAKAGTAMPHAYNPTVPEDVAFCAMTADQAAAIDAALAATVPEDVAPVLPAKVAVPAAAKPAPATVPAGDGSSVPQAPVALLALLALATAGVVASGLRLAMNR